MCTTESLSDPVDNVAVRTALGKADQLAQLAPHLAENSSNHLSEALTHQPQAAGAARRAAHAALEGWSVGGDSSAAVVLVVSELVTNAVEHALPPLTLHMYREAAGSGVWVGVSDGGQAKPEHTRTVSKLDEHGRGLRIVAALADRHGTRAHPGGTTHWARIPT